jgi:FtsZ-interacting cell division protein YlmF
MSTLHKVKAYFGMAPMEDYDDEYYEDDDRTSSRGYTRRSREARTIGERFRDGTPVIMDLVSMDNTDAKRLVDFAAGLAFGLRGSFDKVATKVFLLSPADIDVSAEERRRIAEAGFYAHQ